uniref:Ig-like domain-containing protein n=1 Tax=Seriola lalandi dorsalis TaxID=1841481 RepID=A0A3B4XUJ5_SERLL
MGIVVCLLHYQLRSESLLFVSDWISVSASEFQTVEVQFGEEATLLCWISVSVSEFHTVEVQSGEEVTLMCTNFTSSTSHIFWFRLDNRPNTTCISSMFSSDGNVTFCDGFQNGKFNMTSNITTLFLQIKQVDSSDSGLYFCGSYWNNRSIIVSATYLKVQATLTSAILSALVIFLIIIVIVLGLKIRKLHTGEVLTIYCHLQNPSSADVTYAALGFHKRARKSRGSVSERQLERTVEYTATR